MDSSYFVSNPKMDIIVRLNKIPNTAQEMAECFSTVMKSIQDSLSDSINSIKLQRFNFDSISPHSNHLILTKDNNSADELIYKIVRKINSSAVFIADGVYNNSSCKNISAINKLRIESETPCFFTNMCDEIRDLYEKYLINENFVFIFYRFLDNLKKIQPLLDKPQMNIVCTMRSNIEEFIEIFGSSINKSFIYVDVNKPSFEFKGFDKNQIEKLLVKVKEIHKSQYLVIVFKKGQSSFFFV